MIVKVANVLVVEHLAERGLAPQLLMPVVLVDVIALVVVIVGIDVILVGVEIVVLGRSYASSVAYHRGESPPKRVIRDNRCYVLLSFQWQHLVHCCRSTISLISRRKKREEEKEEGVARSEKAKSENQKA